MVIPTYNRARLVERAIYSVLGQSFRDFELIVVDDGSTDDTEVRIANIPDQRLRYIRGVERLGVSKARNLGVAKARGAFVAFLDSDDEWRVEKLALQVQAFEQSAPDVIAVLCGDVMLNSYSGSFLGVADEAKVVDITSMVVLRIPQPSSWLVRREALNRTGGFDPDLYCFEDWELALRLLEYGRFLLVNEPLTLRQFTAGGLFSNEIAYIDNLKRILDRHERLLRPCAASWSHYCNLIGQTECQYGSSNAGRGWFVRALRARPLSVRSWLNIFMSVFGAGVFKRYVIFARNTRSYFPVSVRPKLPS